MALYGLSGVRGFTIRATDGELGKVVDLYFDDERWTIRYVVADLGTWLVDRKVLISPHAVSHVDANAGSIATDLTKAQVEGSPPIDADRPVSRIMEAEYNRYYGYPAYWAGGYTTGTWGYAAMPLAALEPVLRGERLREARRDAPPAPPDTSEVHLRSGREVTGYHVQATDGAVGRIDDFLFDATSWEIRYLVVDTRTWWPGGRVLVAPQHVANVSWPLRSVSVDVARAAIEQSPPYDAGRVSEQSIARE
jgi:hypothetical protein